MDDKRKDLDKAVGVRRDDQARKGKKADKKK
jgi:hypothetical protein